MVGRSNVGKSTLINALVKKKVARTSAAPGKTRLVNYYLIESPTPQSPTPVFGGSSRLRLRPRRSRICRGVRAAHAGVLDPSTREERRIAGVLQLVDSRHPDLPQDAAGYTWLLAVQAPMAIVATKIDKLNRSEQASTMRTLKKHYDSPVLPVSAVKGDGLDEIWRTIRGWAA